MTRSNRIKNSVLPDKAKLDRMLAQAKQTEVMIILETRELQRLRATHSPWTQAREIRARNLLTEIDTCLQTLQESRRDLQMRLHVMSHAVQAVRSYAKLASVHR